MFLSEEYIANLVNIIREASDKIKGGALAHTSEDGTISVFKTVTSIHSGCWVYLNGVRMLYVDQVSLDRGGNEGIKYSVLQYLQHLGRKQASAKVSGLFIAGHQMAPFSAQLSTYTVSALPMADQRFTQIKVTRGDDIVAIYTTANDIEYSQAMEDVEEILIRGIAHRILEGSIELEI